MIIEISKILFPFKLSFRIIKPSCIELIINQKNISTDTPF